MFAGRIQKSTAKKGKTDRLKVLKIPAFILSIIIVLIVIFSLKEEAPVKPPHLSIIVEPPEFSGSPENEFIASWLNEVLLNGLSSIPNIIVYDQEIRENYVTQPGNTKKLIENSSDIHNFSTLIYEENDEIISGWHITNSEGAVIASGKATIGENTRQSAAQQITQDIAMEFDITLDEETKESLKKIHSINLTAKKFYVQAIRILNGGEIKRKPDLYKTAELLLYRALNADSLFYQAYEELAFMHTNRNYWLNIHNTNFLIRRFILPIKPLK